MVWRTGIDGGGGYKTAKVELRLEAFSFGIGQRTPAQMVEVGAVH